MLVIMGALAYMAILSVGVPAPSTVRADDKSERKLAYEQTIADSANRPLAPEEEDAAADQSWQATVEVSEPTPQGSEPAPQDDGNDVTASLDQPATGARRCGAARTLRRRALPRQPQALAKTLCGKAEAHC